MMELKLFVFVLKSRDLMNCWLLCYEQNVGSYLCCVGEVLSNLLLDVDMKEMKKVVISDGQFR